MRLAEGTRLGYFEIMGPLGVGGMGEVYRAMDTRLRRQVAIKVLPQRFAEDPSRRSRFEREAHVLASLNHPNIAAIYGFDKSSGTNFVVLELVEGPTLADRLSKGPIPVEEALAIAVQIANALETAHDKGIVHRDLKPANLKLTPEGTVKVLDFGLAAVTASAEWMDAENSPTLSMGGTEAGVIMGTPGYMSPEQARALPVDKRTDIWAFGVVLYEMVTGARLFGGKTASDTLASVLKETPDFERAPAKVRGLIQSCLEKDPKKRLRDIGDAWRLVADAQNAAASGRGSTWISWAIAVVALLGLAGLALVHFREKPVHGDLVQFEIAGPPNARLGSIPAVSPDGRRIAFIASGADRRNQVWVRRLDSQDARPLARTEGANSAALFWSPDGRSIAFVSEGKLKRIDLSGGSTQTVCDVSGINGGFWTPDDRILFGTGGPVQMVPAAGGIPKPVTVLDSSRHELAHEAPALLPDGRHFLYYGFALNKAGTYVGSLDAKPDEQHPKRLLDGADAVFVPAADGTRSPPGYLLFESRGAVLAQPFDPDKLELQGDPVPLTERVVSGAFSASPTGVLAYSAGSAGANAQLAWMDRMGNRLETVGEPGEYNNPALSPDGKRVVYTHGLDLWVLELARGGTNTKFTFGGYSDFPTWSPDGKSIAFNAIRAGAFGIYRKPSDMSGNEEQLFQSEKGETYTGYSGDGRFLAFDVQDPKSHYDVLVMPVTGPAAGQPVPLAQSDFNELGGRFSPDSRWISYFSNASGKNEVYVTRFDEAHPQASGAVYQISNGGGADARWRRDGKELFYIAPDQSVMAVEVNGSGTAFQVIGAPKALFKALGTGNWDVDAEGKRFLFAVPAANAGAPGSRPYEVVLNWQEMLKR